jgi:RNA polymerase primary sigma factor
VIFRVSEFDKAIRVSNLTPQTDYQDEEGPALDHVLTDDRSKCPESQMIEADDLDRIFLHLDALEDREATVIRMRFGLESYKPMTLREVGENLGLTRERVRQLESQALRDGVILRLIGKWLNAGVLEEAMFTAQSRF